MSRSEGPATLWAREDLASLGAQGLRRQLDTLDGPQGPTVSISGRSFINFSSNDYLGLATDPRPAKAMAESALAHGSGMGSARLVVGSGRTHALLEAALARFFRTDAALVFSSGYAANLGAMQALLGPEDVVFSDALNHASLIDGCRLSRARVVVYPHRDMPALHKLLGEHSGRRRLIATDAVFSMDGDVAPVADLAQLAKDHRTALYVDEAHAVGVLGENAKGRGAGLCDAAGVEDAVDLRMVGFGKSLGTSGAAVAGSSDVVNLILNRARGFVFSTSLPAPVCAAAEASLALIQNDSKLRTQLWRNIRRLAEGLNSLGLPSLPQSPIFPVVLGTPERALSASKSLMGQGFWIKAIRPPTVPEGTSRLRMSVTSEHSEHQIDALVAALKDLRLRP